MNYNEWVIKLDIFKKKRKEYLEYFKDWTIED